MFNRLKKRLPTQDFVEKHPILSRFGGIMLHPRLWRFNRHTVARAIFIGVFSAFIPLPIETIIAASLAIAFGGNLPLSVVLVWISNPLTWIPMYTPGYFVGCALLRIEAISLDTIEHFNDFYHLLSGEHFTAVVLGSAVLGITFGAIGFMIVHAAWRYTVRSRWRDRVALRNRRKMFQRKK